MHDISISYNKYKFLGNEFLTWLWYLIDNEINIKEMIAFNLVKKEACKLTKAESTETGNAEAKSEWNSIVLEIGNSIVLENSLGDESVEKISIKGDDAGLEEGGTALKKGALVTDINLIMQINDNEWRFNIKGESMEITSLKTPSSGKIENKEDTEGAVLERVFLYNKVFEVIDILFHNFIKRRLSETWKSIDITAIKKWIEL